MSRSIRQEIPDNDCMVERARQRMRAAGIPELHCRRTREDWELAKKILQEEEDLYTAKAEARQKGWPWTKDMFLNAIKAFIQERDGLLEPTHVTLPPAMCTIVNTWGTNELPVGYAFTKDNGRLKEGDVFCNLTVVFGDEFKLEDR